MLSKWWVVFTSVLYFSILNAQYADTVHRTDTQHEFTFAYNWDNTYLTSVSELRDSNTNIYKWSYLQFKQYDENFNVIRETRFQDSIFRYWGRSLTFLNDAYYFSGFQTQTGQDTILGYVVKFDSIGNVIWKKNYFTDIERTRIRFIENKGTNLHIVGSKYNPSTTNTIETFLCQIDTSGAIQWTKIFSQVFDQQPISYKSTSDGGGVLAMAHIIENTNYKRTANYWLSSSFSRTNR
jgi:hypothetical protein